MRRHRSIRALTAGGGALLLSGGEATFAQTAHVYLVADGRLLLLTGGVATLTAYGACRIAGGRCGRCCSVAVSATLETTAGTTLVATGGALLLSGGEAALLTTGPIVLDATGGTLLLSGTTTATLEVGAGAPPPVVGAGPGPPRRIAGAAGSNSSTRRPDRDGSHHRGDHQCRTLMDSARKISLGTRLRGAEPGGARDAHCGA